MTLKKLIGTGAIAGALGFSAIGLAGVASAVPMPQASPGVVHQAQLTGWADPAGMAPGGAVRAGAEAVGADRVGVPDGADRRCHRRAPSESASD